MEKYVSKHLYECSNRFFKLMPIYQTDDDSSLQIKEKKIKTYIKPSLISYIYIHTQNQISHTHSQAYIHKLS